MYDLSLPVLIASCPRMRTGSPFIYQGELFISHSLCPHKVLSVLPNGTCKVAYASDTKKVLRPHVSACVEGPRGNTQLHLIPKEQSGRGKDFYLGE